MAAKSNTPLDLELNLFENSFASKDLLHAHTGENNEKPESPGPEASSRSTATSSASHNSSSMSRSSGSGTSSEMLEIKPRPAENFQSTESKDMSSKSNPPLEDQQAAVGQGNNKHNLRLSNFANLNNERLPGLTPPVFTPGGRRLPPIHLSPGIAVASPGTPGSNLWSSLLTATNGAGAGAVTEQHPGLYTQPSYPSYMRKSGLVPTESNLRSGLTPGLINHSGFNFNIPDPMSNGQMTPGLQTLLGLVNHPTDQPGLAEQAAETSNANACIPQQQPTDSQLHVPDASVEKKPSSFKEKRTQPESASAKIDVPAKSKKRTQRNEESDSKSKSQKVSKVSTPSKIKTEAKDDPEGKKNAEEEDLDEEEKRKQFLERNRVAALKCRQRKKQQLNKMENELAFYSDGYRDLTAQVGQLRDQLMILRGLLINHKDCPSLSNSLGGYQQLQNLLSQADYVAHGGKPNEHPFSAIPTTIPNILNNPLPSVKHADTMLMNGQEPMPSVTQNLNVPNHSEVVHGMHMHDTHSLINRDTLSTHQNSDQIPFDADLIMGRQFSSANNQHTGLNAQQKNNLRPVNSTSNLQHSKNDSQVSSYDLRPIASMADLQHHNSNASILARQFQL